MNLSSVIVLLIVLLIIGLALRKIIKDKKSGKTCSCGSSGCGGSCSSCSSPCNSGSKK